MWGSIIGAGISAAGSLFGASKAEDAAKAQQQLAIRENRIARKVNRKKEALARRREDNFVRRRVHDAKQAGIHPLAALGASYSPGSFAQAVGAPATGSTGGDGITAAANTIGNAVAGYDNTELMQLQKAEILSRIKANEATTMLTAAQSRSTIADAARKVQVLNTDKIKQPPNVNHIRMWNQALSTAKGWSDTETVEQRWGEGGAFLYGLFGPMLADLDKWTNPQYRIQNTKEPAWMKHWKPKK